MKMPKPVDIMKMSWEDIEAQAEMRKIKLTKKQIIEAFDLAERNSTNECLMGAYWANIDYAIDEVNK